MIITITQEDLRAMPAALREQLVQFVSDHVGGVDGAASAGTSDFKFVDPPPRARHPSKKLVSLQEDQAREFVKDWAKKDESGDILKVLIAILDTWDDMSFVTGSWKLKGPSDLAEQLQLLNKEKKLDPRLVSSYLKKVTHAIRDYTGNSDAGWYTLTRAGDFWVDEATRKNLVSAIRSLVTREIAQ